MQRVFQCQQCGLQLRRFAAAMAPEACPYCQSSRLGEVVPEATRTGSTTPQPESDAPSQAPRAFACERGETCTRLSGGQCPGGKGC